MTTISDLSDEDLALCAKDWRHRALRGDKSARGVAHDLEAELRLRGNPSFVHQQAAPDELDTRPARLRSDRPWWRRLWER
ncbi:MAG: hypothetical protein V4636_12720 [Pseudomonadota bacterium]